MKLEPDASPERSRKRRLQLKSKKQIRVWFTPNFIIVIKFVYTFSNSYKGLLPFLILVLHLYLWRQIPVADKCKWNAQLFWIHRSPSLSPVSLRAGRPVPILFIWRKQSIKNFFTSLFALSLRVSDGALVEVDMADGGWCRVGLHHLVFVIFIFHIFFSGFYLLFPPPIFMYLNASSFLRLSGSSSLYFSLVWLSISSSSFLFTQNTCSVQ